MIRFLLAGVLVVSIIGCEKQEKPTILTALGKAFYAALFSQPEPEVIPTPEPLPEVTPTPKPISDVKR